MRMLRVFEAGYACKLAHPIALGKIRRHHQDGFEGGLIKGLGLPALPAALPLAAVIFQRDDDREQRRNCRGFCLIVQHPATISSKAISAVQFIPPHGKFLDRGEWKDESRGPCLAGTSPGMAGLRTLCGCTS